jgi:hypothetical protein
MMISIRNAVCCAALFASAVCACGIVRAADDEIDWRRTQDLYNRSTHGEKLSPEDQQYLDHAKEVRKKLSAEGKAPWRGIDGGKPNNPDGGRQTGEMLGKAPTGLMPLTELGTGEYKGEDGGLYGGGSNDPPAEHAAAAKKAVAEITPRDAQGTPSGNGKIVLLGVGMSNTTQEFSRFKELADKDAEKSSQLVIVDGAQGGQAARQWAGESVYQVVEKRLQASGVTTQQVQVVWLKQANIRPTGDLKEHAKTLENDLGVLVRLLKKHYPNLRVAYLSSRTYGGYARTPLNPEPYAYEGAFAVRWLIQDQIKKNPQLNYDASRGAVTAPLLLWGPYLWADGTTPRKSDGFAWDQKDFGADGTHPSESGRQKVAELLLKFLKSDADATTWFFGAHDATK